MSKIMHQLLKKMGQVYLLCSLTSAVYAVDNLPYWRDMKVTSVGTEAPRTDFMTYDNRQQALTLRYEASPYYRSLNGTWQFYYTDNHQTLPEDITGEQADKVSWKSIQVPGNWEVQGFGDPIYVNHPYEFAPTRPQPPHLPDEVPVGVYRRTFTVPSTWNNRDIYLQVDGAKSGCYVYINGREVGYNEDSKNPATYRINDFLKKGDNQLVLKMYRWTTASFLECQDFWRLSGIERDVFLFSRTRTAIRDFRITSTLDESCTKGVFRLSVDLSNSKSTPENLTVAYELMDANGRCVSQGESTVFVPSAGKQTLALEATLPEVSAWSAESPYLYRLLMTLRKGDRVVECIPMPVGFRRIEIKPSHLKAPSGSSLTLLYINGQPLKLKGVNLHEHNPKTGHYVPEALILQDLTLMRQANINTIRLCHYPQSRRFYELCDSLGFYVYDEANIESHAMYYDLRKGGTLGNNPEWLQPHLYRTINMFERNKNHPSVTFWSLGNEAGNGYNFYQTYLWLKEADRNVMARPVNYERALWEWNTDMYVPQYPSAGWLAKIGRIGSDRPVVPSEYAHAMGNSTGGLHKQWQAIWNYANLQGGYIWDWVDQGLLAHDENGTPYYTYGGDYGTNLPSDGNFCCNGLVAADRTPHPGLKEVAYVHQDIAFSVSNLQEGRFIVKNRHYFTSLGKHRLIYRIMAGGKVIRSGRTVMDIAPQDSAEWRIDLSGLKPRVGAEYFIEFSAVTTEAAPLRPVGSEVAHEQFRLPVEPLAQTFKTSGPKLSIADEGHLLKVSSSLLTFVFDRQQGSVTSYKVRGTEYIHEGFGFRPNFWRAPTDNDYGNQMPLRLHVWKVATETLNVKKATVAMEGEDALLHVAYQLPTGNLCHTDYRISPSGVVHVAYHYMPTLQKAANAGFNEAQATATYTPGRGEDDLSKLTIPRIGMRFRLPVAMNGVSYLGRGPEENYCDRNASSLVGLWRSKADEMGADYIRPQENGHRTGVRWLSLYTRSGKGITLYADSLMEINVLRNSVEEFDGQEAVKRPYQWRNKSANDLRHDEAQAVNRLPRQTHTTDIVPQNFVEVCLDLRQMGVGGYDSWGSQPDAEDLIPASNAYCWGFTVVPSAK